MSTNAATGTRVRELRMRAKQSQAWLARQMNSRGASWHQTTVHRIETGKQAILLKEAVAVAQIFNVPLASLSQGETLTAQP